MAGIEIEAIDVERDGRWCQVLLVQAPPAAEALPGEVPFVGVVSADLGPDLPAILAALRPGLQEIVCFDSLTEPTVTGADLAFRALDELGFGQDFVFTVPTLEGATDHAVDTLLAPDHGGWEGRCVVVIGPTPVLERAGRHLRG